MNLKTSKSTNNSDFNLIEERLLNASEELHIKKWDIGASTSVDKSVQVDQGEAKQLKASQRSSITVRVWNEEDLIGITSTSDISFEGLRQALLGAKEASYFGNPKDTPQFSCLARDPLPELNRPLKEALTIQKLFQLLKSAERELLESHPAIETIPYNGLNEAKIERIYLNSDNANRRMERTQSSIYLYARAEEKGRKPRSGGAVRLALGSEELDIESCIKEAADRTISHLNYESVNTGKYLVCFKPEAILELINSFSSIFNARYILDGLSLSSKDSLGTNIAVPYFSLYDNGLHPDNLFASSFDGEGTPTQNICLIDSGILNGFIHSEATARSFKVRPTGHAGLGAKVSVGTDWLEIKNSKDGNGGDNSLQHKTYNGKYILIENLNALHAGVKASQGSFSLPFDGWLVNNGEKISIEAATVAGDIKNVLQNIVNIEHEQTSTHQGVAPHVWVEELSITGEA